MSIDVSGFKQGQKAMWTAGDYPDIARRIVAVGEYLAVHIAFWPCLNPLTSMLMPLPV